MASKDVEQGAKKIAELTLGVEGIHTALEEAKKDISEQSTEIQDLISQGLKKGIDSIDFPKIDFKDTAIDTEQLNQAKKAIDQVDDEYGKLLKTIKKYKNDDNEPYKKEELYENAKGIRTKLIKDLKGEEEELTTVVENNIERQEKKREASLKKQAAEQEKFTRVILGLNDQISKQNLLEKEASTKGKDYSALIGQSKAYRSELEEIHTKLVNNGKVTSDEIIRIRQIRNEAKILSNEYSSMNRRKAEEAKETRETQRATQDLLEIEKQIANQKILTQKITDKSSVDGSYLKLSQQSKEYLSQLKKIYAQGKANGKLTVDEKTNFIRLQTEIKKTAYEYDSLNKQKKDFENFNKQIDKMIAKQKEFTRTVDKQSHTPINRDIIEQSKNYTRELERMKANIIQVGSVSEKAQADLNNMGSKVKVLAGTYQEAGFQGEGFLAKITDKAKWVSAFYIVNALKEALLESVKVIKETEDASVELQRVLSKPVAPEEITDKLYGIAKDYGRSFEDVQEIAIKFAQTGKSWNETLDLTKSAMLALNTAEMDVTESTEGLIAITSQWNIDASKTEEIIDKINITADNFSVTSEKIVSALQRASGSARQAGLKIEDTIAAITALSEATGRSGENIGTALNSLLIYTSKDKALKAFYEVGNETVKKTVDSYRAGASSILDVWKALGQNMQQLSEKQKDILYQGIGGDEFAQHLEDNASEITDDIKKIYGSVGTFRQNYFVALLNDIKTVDKVTKNMDKSVGYSKEENEKYMQTLTALFNQLIVLWKELIVEAGEGKLGIMDFLKLITHFAIGLSKVIKTMGGITPLLGLILGILIKIKATQINNMFLNMAVGIEKFGLKIKEAGGGLKGFLTVMKTSKSTTEGFAASLGTLQIALSLVAMAYSAISTAVSAYLDKKKEERQESIIDFNAKADEAKATTTLYNEYVALRSEYEKTGEKTEKFISVTNQLAETLGITGVSANSTGDKFDTLAEKIDNAKEKLFGFSKMDADLQVKNAEKELEDAAKGGKGLFGIPINNIGIDTTSIENLPEKIKPKIQEAFKGISVLEIFDNKTVLAPIEGKIKDFEKAIRESKAILDDYYVGASESEKQGLLALGNSLDEINSQLGESYETYAKSLVQQKMLSEEVPATVEAYKSWKQEILDIVDVDEELKNQLSVFIDEMFPQFTEKLEETTTAFAISKEQLETLETAIDSLNKKIDSMQSGYGTVSSAIEQFNQDGVFTIDTVQSLINAGYDYINLLEFTENGIKLNKQATQELTNEQENNVKEMVKLAATAQILELAQKYLDEANGAATNSSEKLNTGLQGLEDEVNNITSDFLNGAIAANEFAINMAKVLQTGDLPERFDMAGFLSDSEKIVINSKKLLDNLDVTFQRSDKGAENAAKNAAKKKYDDEKKEIQRLKEAENDKYKDEKKKIDDIKKAIKERYDAEQKELKKRKDTLKDQFDKEKEALERQKELVADRYDSEIEKKKEIQKENDRIDKQEEYLRNRREAEKDKEKASVRSGIEYREAEEEAEQKISDLDRGWGKTLRDWKVEDEIKALENLRDTQIKSIEVQIELLEAKHKIEVDNIDKLIEKSKEQEEIELKAQEKNLETLAKEHEAVIKDLEGRLKAIENVSNAGATIYKNNFLNQTEKDTADTTKRLSKAALNVANYTAQELHDIYMREFFDKIKREQIEMQKAIQEAAKIGFKNGDNINSVRGYFDRFRPPTVSFDSFSKFPTVSSRTTYNNTTTNSKSNITNNIWGESGAKKNFNSFFTNP